MRVRNVIKSAYYTFARGIKVASLGYGTMDKVKVFYGVMVSPIKKRLSLGNEFNVNLSIKWRGEKIDLILTELSNLVALYVVFIKRDYDIKTGVPVETIIDLGGNIGLSAIFFTLKYPNSSIYVFEANPNTYKLLSKNVAPFSNISSYNLAVAGSSKDRDLYLVEGKSTMSSFVNRVGSGASSIRVKAKTLDDIVKDLDIHKIDLLKFDIEGAEFEVFHNSNSLNIVDTLIGELHTSLIGHTKEEFEKIFNSFNLKYRDNEFAKTGIIEITKNDN